MKKNSPSIPEASHGIKGTSFATHNYCDWPFLLDYKIVLGAIRCWLCVSSWYKEHFNIHNTVFFATHNSLYPSEKKTVFVMFEPTYYIFNGYHVYTPEATFSYNSNIQYSVTSVNVHRPMMPFSQYWYNIPHFLGISQTSKWIKWMVSLQRFSHIANSIQIIDVCFYSLE